MQFHNFPVIHIIIWKRTSHNYTGVCNFTHPTSSIHFIKRISNIIQLMKKNQDLILLKSERSCMICWQWNDKSYYELYKPFWGWISRFFTLLKLRKWILSLYMHVTLMIITLKTLFYKLQNNNNKRNLYKINSIKLVLRNMMSPVQHNFFKYLLVKLVAFNCSLCIVFMQK